MDTEVGVNFDSLLHKCLDSDDLWSSSNICALLWLEFGLTVDWRCVKRAPPEVPSRRGDSHERVRVIPNCVVPHRLPFEDFWWIPSCPAQICAIS